MVYFLLKSAVVKLVVRVKVVVVLVVVVVVTEVVEVLVLILMTVEQQKEGFHLSLDQLNLVHLI